MWQGEPFAASGRPTGVDNTVRSFRWFKPSSRLNLPLVPLVPCVRAIAGVGAIGSPAMPGSVPRNCVSVSLAFQLF